MLRKTFLLYVFCRVVLVLSAQVADTVRVFPFNEPFPFSETWDLYEGSPVGPEAVLLLGDTIIVANRTGKMTLYMFNADTYEEKSHIILGNGAFLVRPGKTIAFGSIYDRVTISLDGIFPEKDTFEIDMKKNRPDERISMTYPLYLSGNMLFAQTENLELISWELSKKDGVMYHNVEETKKWLDEGNDKIFGYVETNGRKYFGEFTMDNSVLGLNYFWGKLIFPEGHYRNTDILNQFKYIGNDKKGVNYYYALGSGPFKKRYTKSEPENITIGIIDTWTKKVKFVEFPKGTWNPPRNGETLLGYYTWAVSPDGDLFFFDANEQKKEYYLKKISHTWLLDPEIEAREIARIKENHIPLMNESDGSTGNNGFCYENEYVWIIEKMQPKKEIVKGEGLILKIRKLDGREGWIPSSKVYYE